MSKINPIITYNPTQPNYAYGTQIGSSNLNATANVPGTFTYRLNSTTGPIVTSTTVINAGSSRIFALFAPTDTSIYNNVSTNRVFNISKVNLNISCNSQTMFYSSPSPTFTSTYTGFVNGDTESTALLGSLVYIITDSNSNNVTNTLSTQNVGTYTITVLLGTLNSINYNLIITQSTAPLTIVQTTPIINYSLVTNPYTYGNQITSGNLNANATNPYNSNIISGNFTYTLSSTSGTQVFSTTILNTGSYTIYANFIPNDTTNYVSTANNYVSLTVNKADLNITCNPQIMVYSSNPPTFTSSYNGFVNGDTESTALTGNLSYAITNSLSQNIPINDLPTQNVGTYTITVSLGTLASVNYNLIFTQPPTALLTIIQATPTINYSLVTNPYTYANIITSGNLNANATNPYNSSNISGNFTYTLNSPSGTQVYSTTILNAGSYNIYANFIPNDTTNYVSTANNYASLTVNQADLYITCDSQTMIYGTQPPTFTSTYTGFVNGDTASTALTGELEYVITDSSSPPIVIPYNLLSITNVGTYTITVYIDSLSSTNYNLIITQPPTAPLTITQATPGLSYILFDNSYPYGIPIRENNLNAITTTTIEGFFIYKINSPTTGTEVFSNTILDVGTYDIYAIFYPDDTINYISGTYISASNGPIVVSKLATQINYTLATREYQYGNILTSGNINASAVIFNTSIIISGTFTYTIINPTPSGTQVNANTILSINSYNIYANFIPDNIINFDASSSLPTNNPLEVTTVNANIVLINTINTSISYTYNTINLETNLNGSAYYYYNSIETNVPGTFVYTYNLNNPIPINTDIIDAGTWTIYAIFTPNDNTIFNIVDKQITLTVNKANVTLTLQNSMLYNYNYNSVLLNLNGEAIFESQSIGGTFQYINNSIDVTNTILNAGFYNILCNYAPPDNNFNSISNFPISLTINKIYATLSYNLSVPINTYNKEITNDNLNAVAINPLNNTVLPGTFIYTLNSTSGIQVFSNTILNTSSYYIWANFYPQDSTNYYNNDVISSSEFIINQATPIFDISPNDLSYIYNTYSISTNLTQYVSAYFIDMNNGSNVYISGTVDYKYSLSGSTINNTVLNANNTSYNVYIIFTPTDTLNFITINTLVSFTVSQATPTLIYNPSTPTYTYNSQITSGNLNAYATFENNSLSGTFVYRLNDSINGQILNNTTILNANLDNEYYTIYAIFTANDTTNFVSTTTFAELTVLRANPDLTYNPNTPTYTYNSQITSENLNAYATFNSSSLSGSFVYRLSSTSGTQVESTTILDANLDNEYYTVYAIFTATDTLNFNVVNTFSYLTVLRADPIVNYILATPSYTYNAPITSANLNAVAYFNNQILDGTFVYRLNNISTGQELYDTTILNANIDNEKYTIYAIFTASDTINFNTASSYDYLTVYRADPILSYNPLNPVYIYGIPIGKDNLNAVAEFDNQQLNGVFVYRLTSVSGQIITFKQILSFGTYTIYALFYPTDVINFNSGLFTYTDNIEVLKKEIFISVDPKTMIYGTNPPPQLTFTADGTFTDLDFLSSITVYTITDSESNVINYDDLYITDVGIYTITLTITNTVFTNYEITIVQNDAPFVILERDLYVSPDPKSMIYYSIPPVLTSTYTGFVNNQNVYTLDGFPIYTITNSSSPPVIIDYADLYISPVGNYTITLSLGTLYAKNYNIQIGTSTSNLTINKTTLYVKPDFKSSVYSFPAPLLTSTYIGFVNGDTELNSLSGRLFYSIENSSLQSVNYNDIPLQNVGNYTISITLGTITSTNYNIIILESTSILAISKKILYVSVNSIVMTYGSYPPPLSSSYSGFANGDNASSLTGTLTYVITDSNYYNINYVNLNIKSAGVYTITVYLSTINSQNYNIEIENRTSSLTINTKILYIDVNSLTIVYGTNAPLTSSYYGFVNNDTVSNSLSGSLSYIITDLLLNVIDSNNLSLLQVGTYIINLFIGSLTSVNYNLTIRDANNYLYVTKRTLSIYPDNKNITYGSYLPTFTFTYSGLVNGDTISSSVTIDFVYLVRDSDSNIINTVIPYIYDAGIYTITIYIISSTSDNYNIIANPDTGTLIIEEAMPTISYTLPITSYEYSLPFPSENFCAIAYYNNEILDGTFVYRLGNIYGPLLLDTTILNAGNYSVCAIFTPNNKNYSSTNTNRSFTVNKLTPTIVYSIPEAFKTMMYGTKFVTQQLTAYVEHNGIIIKTGTIVFKLSLSTQAIITTSNYPNLDTSRIYAVFNDHITNNYNSVDTFDTITVILGQNMQSRPRTFIKNLNNSGLNGQVLTNLNQTIQINGEWYIYNPHLGYYSKVERFV